MINLSALRVACSNCNLREACMPTGRTLKEIERLEDLVATRRRIKRGEALFQPVSELAGIQRVQQGKGPGHQDLPAHEQLGKAQNHQITLAHCLPVLHQA